MTKSECVLISIARPDGSVAIMQFVTEHWAPVDDAMFAKLNAARVESGLKPVAENMFKMSVREATPENIEYEILKANLTYTGWRIITSADVPQDRTFRDAWTDTGDKIDHDMGKARAIHMNRIRMARNEKLSETDKLVSALDGNAVPPELKERRQKLRDIPQTFDLSKYTTPEQLKAAWPAELV